MSSLIFRWLGANGIELQAEGYTLVLDPFMTRPPIWRVAFTRLKPDLNKLAQTIPVCDAILISHSHYDHLMDAPALAAQTGALIAGSENTCRAAALSGVSDKKICQIAPGDSFSLGPFQIAVLAARHKPFPGLVLLQGEASAQRVGSWHAAEYRLDVCLSYLIDYSGLRMLFCPSSGVPADFLWIGPGWPKSVYEELFTVVRPRWVAPLHWENFFLPVNWPFRSIPQLPGTIGLKGMERLALNCLPECQFVKPEVLTSYRISNNPYELIAL
jgi:L-ascorbate metabolism protein UlaG (beta-lactamase superfamily)